MIFSIAMDADNSFYVKFIATYAPTFFGYIISVLAMVITQMYQLYQGKINEDLDKKDKKLGRYR